MILPALTKLRVLGVGTLLSTDAIFYLNVFNLSSAAFVITIALTAAGRTKADVKADVKADGTKDGGSISNQVSTNWEKIK